MDIYLLETLDADLAKWQYTNNNDKLPSKIAVSSEAFPLLKIQIAHFTKTTASDNPTWREIPLEVDKTLEFGETKMIE